MLAPPIHPCENCGRSLRRRYRLKVRTEPSQGSNPGSSPGIATTSRELRYSLPCLLDVAGFNSLFFEILLVIFLGAVKFRSRSNFGDDRALEHSFFNQDFLRGPSGGFLLHIVKEDSRAVLRTHIRPLAVQCSGVMALPENGKKLEVGHFCRIELDFHGFRMSGAPAANILISGILHGPAGITNDDGSDSRHLAEGVLHTPETTRCKCSLSHRFQLLSSYRIPMLPYCVIAVESAVTPWKARWQIICGLKQAGSSAARSSCGSAAGFHSEKRESRIRLGFSSTQRCDGSAQERRVRLNVPPLFRCRENSAAPGRLRFQEPSRRCSAPAEASMRFSRQSREAAWPELRSSCPGRACQ